MTLLTTGAIAERLNVDRDLVSYAVRKLAIKPLGVAGQVRVFPENTPSAVKKFLDKKREKAKT
ncbi:MAG: hypothetical protein HQ580_15190 [Planctomycetes bacterium]|nr:hypothetical protein [Planctomycetota bacterium]